MQKSRDHFRDYRQLSGLRQQDVADILHVSKTTYASYEQGIAEADYATLKKLSSYYGITINQLLGQEDENLIVISKEQYDDLKKANELLSKALGKIEISGTTINATNTRVIIGNGNKNIK